MGRAVLDLGSPMHKPKLCMVVNYHRKTRKVFTVAEGKWGGCGRLLFWPFQG